MEALRRHGPTRRLLALTVLVLLAGALAVRASVRLGYLVADESGRDQVLVVATAAGALLVVAVAAFVGLRGERSGRARRAAYVVLGGVALLLPAAAAATLHGTRWGFAALSGDAAFRTEAVTRHADEWGLGDYAYADLPAYYPPALSWLQGRTAALLDVEAWTVMQPSQLLLAAVVPLLAFVFWRRVVPALPAAALVAVTALLTADLVKPDEWLVLMCAVPWWLDVVRGARGVGVRAWPWWAHGLVGGLVLLTHTFYLLPLAVAALLGWAVDLVRRRPLELGPLRAAAIAATGVVLATPYWLPILLARLGGAPTDNFQMRYTYPGANVPPWPLPYEAPGVLGAIGVVWLLAEAWRARRVPADDEGEAAWRRRAGAVAVLLAGAYLTMAGGGLGVMLGVGLLTFKTDELVVLGFGAAGTLGLVRAATLLAASPVVRRPRTAPRDRPGVGTVVGAVSAAVVVASLTVLVTSDYIGHTVLGRRAVIAQTTPYPDGSLPESARGRPPLAGPAFTEAGDPSTEEVADAWRELSGRPLDSDTVLVTTQVALLATSTAHPFTTWKAIYSNPLGQFEPRLDLLREVAACADPACAADLLRDNPYDAVDGLVLERRGDELVLRVLVDGFPDRTRGELLTFPGALFDGPGFARTDVGRIALVALDPPA